LAWGGAALEQQVWNHPSIEYIGMGIRIKPSVKAEYETLFMGLCENPQNQKYINALDNLVTQHFAGAYDGLRYLQRFSLDVLTQPPSPCVEAQQDMQQLCSTAESGQNTGLSRQCETFCFALPTRVFSQSQKSTEDIAYNLASHAFTDDNLPEYMPQGFNPNKLLKTGKQSPKQARQQWALTLAGNGKLNIAPIDMQSEASLVNTQAPVIATIEAKASEPLLLSHAGQTQQRLVHAATIIAVAESICTLVSSQQRLHIKGITKPTWAQELGYNASARCYVKIAYRGQAKKAELKYHSGDSSWQLPSPFGQDQYGFYQDVDIKGINQRFRWIPPGEFLMGSPDNELDRDDNEVQHKVIFNKGFWLADTTVTQTLWQRVMQGNPSDFKGEENPVDSKSWVEAQTFIQHINNEISGLDASLPSEAQWEYACRAGTTAPFNWGSDRLDSQQANFNGNSPYSDNPKSGFRQTTVAVKDFSPNRWGLYQMHGNVWEWCTDEYKADLAEPARDRFIGFRLALGLELKAGGASAHTERSEVKKKKPIAVGDRKRK